MNMSKKDFFGLGVVLMILGGTAFVLPMLGLQWELFSVFGGSWEMVAGGALLGGGLMAVCNKDH
jgi:hypothetical protein